jgi:hypothetical protein
VLRTFSTFWWETHASEAGSRPYPRIWWETIGPPLVAAGQEARSRVSNRGAPLAYLVVALELLSLLGRSLTGPIDRRLSLGKGQDRVYGGVGVLRQSLVVDVGQVVAELVVAPVERHAGGTAAQRDLVRLLDDLCAGEDPAGRNPGSRERVVV